MAASRFASSVTEIIVMIASYPACVAHTKAIIHPSVGESGGAYFYLHFGE